MIEKPFSIPLTVLQLEALNRRLSPDHPAKFEITKRLRHESAGAFGEQEVFRHLQLLPEQQFRIFHDLRLHDSIGFFQLDILLITTSFILNLEVKNYRGEVHFNEFDQLIQIQEDGREQVIDENPVTQAQRHGLQLHSWLQQNDFPKMPIFSYVVFSSPKTLIKNNSANKEYHEYVVSSSNILPKIHEIYSKVRTPAIGHRQLNHLVERLLECHKPLRLNILEQFKVADHDLVKGVLCPYCPQSAMEEHYGKWTCPKCQYSSYDVFIDAFNDYYLLIGKEITNREGREFLQIPSKDKMNRLLKKAGYHSYGVTAGRRYILEYRKPDQRLGTAVK